MAGTITSTLEWQENALRWVQTTHGLSDEAAQQIWREARVLRIVNRAEYWDWLLDVAHEAVKDKPPNITALEPDKL